MRRALKESFAEFMHATTYALSITIFAVAVIGAIYAIAYYCWNISR